MVGDHYDFLYSLTGPIAAGSYALALEGEVLGNGTVVAAELDQVSDAGVAARLFTQTFTLDADGGQYVGGLFDAGVALSSVDAGCGDTLRLRLSIPQGPDGGEFYFFAMQLSLP